MMDNGIQTKHVIVYICIRFWNRQTCLRIFYEVVMIYEQFGLVVKLLFEKCTGSTENLCQRGGFQFTPQNKERET